MLLNVLLQNYLATVWFSFPLLMLPMYCTSTRIDIGTSVTEVAEFFHISVAHFERQTHKYFDCGVISLFNKKRLSRARVLLKSTDLSVGEIAAQVGFYDTPHFSSFFTMRMGMTPSQYRNGKQRNKGD